MNKLSLATAIATLLAASPALAQEITIWDFNGSDAARVDYYAQAKAEFEAAHPGAVFNLVAQPFDQYYTLLGTALSSSAGPDVFEVNGGGQAKSRFDAMIKLNDKAADLISSLVGTEAFSDDDGNIYALPTTIQGHMVYYNKQLYKDAGLDPEAAPTTWAELTKVCEAFKAQGKVPCFTMGNKEGYAAEFFFSSIAAESWTHQEQVDWAAGKLHWSDPPVKAILQTWIDMNADGWFQKGPNSTTKFMDEYENFMRGDGANTMGLLSDVANWKQFETEMGAENVGEYPMPAPTVAADKTPGQPGVPFAGGVGYAVNKDSPNIDLAVAAIEALDAPGPIATFLNSAGAMPANTAVDLAAVNSPGLANIVSWLSTRGVMTAHANASSAELDEWHRQSQLLLNGDTTVDEAAAVLDGVQAEAKPQN